MAAPLPAPQAPRVDRPEFQGPASNRFVGDRDPAFEQHFLDEPGAERKPEIELHRMGDDLRRKTVTLIADVHPKFVSQTQIPLSNVTSPEMLQDRIKRVRFIGNERPDRWAGPLAEYEEMIVALGAPDGDALAEVLGRHLDNSLERVRRRGLIRTT